MSVEITSAVFYFDELLDALDDNIDLTLEAVGGYVRDSATLRAPVDTGLLKNSLTYAVAGEPPADKIYQADKPDKSGEIKTGKYEGSTTKADGEYAVYIGTNVEYAEYQETGTSKTKAQPFLKPAVDDNIDRLRELIKQGLKGELTE